MHAWYLRFLLPSWTSCQAKPRTQHAEQFLTPHSPLTLAALRVAPDVGVLEDRVVLARLVGAC